MKTLIILFFFLFLNLYINLILILNYFYMNSFITPLKQMLYLIFYIIFMSINTLMYKQMISLNLYILLIIFISGILILFSYFISLINKPSKKFNYLNLFIMYLILMLISLPMIYKYPINIKMLNFNYSKNNKIYNIKKLYLNPNYYILLMFIVFLVMMLFIMTKICYIKNKNLRAKKWKK
nr:TPA_asm: ND6 [Bombus vosnesenskii]